MSKLLRANFARLWKNKVFWGCMIFIFTDALHTVVSQYLYFKEYGDEPGANISEGLLFGQTVAVSLVTAVFIGLFIGTEYSCGTMRNKMIVGQSRTAVYFSNLVVCIAAALMMHITYLLTTYLAGLVAFGNFITPNGKFFMYLGFSFIIVTAFAAMFLPVSMLVSSKSSGSTAVILMSFVLIIAALVIYSALNEPEYYEAYTYITEGEEFYEPAMDNPSYPRGIKRKIYEALYDILPTCQAARLQEDDMPENPAVIPLWSSAVIVVTTAAGAFIFRRKDLK